MSTKTPDECYCINTNKDISDLAIEVIYSSGGLDTLKIYQLLGTKEVWLWQNNQFQVYCLQNNEFQKESNSKLFPDLDLALLGDLVTINNPLQSIVECGVNKLKK